MTDGVLDDARTPSFVLRVLADRLAVCRVDRAEAVPGWAGGTGLFSVTRTADELSLVCEEARVPASVTAERGWRALMVQGPLEFSMVGVLAALAGVLAEARVSIFVLSTYDTDYVLVKETQLEGTLEALQRAGHQVVFA
ncbi:MAG: ACT domain-containing protein [Anaerolineales bacterium]|jgi:hypothetical protein|nr:ACT domain-containing protein [Anaerolineales bacterium]